ncbi:prenyltransferase/squalene oxidase repeat-containing protein [Streptomyces sp. NPDC020807]|uniref:prenyltransferase/squalene oxidase repeat-containing protein n=1 Tax=Streptomyces sp. NPDC020807 TaxID=3155119 RepID=UPI0033DB2EA8
MNTVRRAAAALATAAVVIGSGAALAAPAAAAPSPSTSDTSATGTSGAIVGLYGSGDPTYDGVWRQSYAFLAQRGAGYQPADQAVKWLLAQQCADGSFSSYRADSTKPCDDKTMRDTNATALAVQALGAVRRQYVEPEKAATAVKAGTDWLRTVQNKDGGWSYSPGGPSDANSTSVIVSALAATGTKPTDFTSVEGHNPYDALLSFALPCSSSDKADAGAFAYQPDKDGKLVANADATAAATLAGLGKSVVARKVEPEQKPTCQDLTKPTAERAALNGSAYLAKALAKTGYLVAPPMPGATDTTEKPDVGNTADAVIALAATGATDEALPSLEWLQENSAAWAKKNGPAAYAQLILAARSMDTDPSAFGTVNLVSELNALGPEPKVADNSTAATDDEDSGFDVWWIIGIGMVVGVGIGFLMSGRKK